MKLSGIEVLRLNSQKQLSEITGGTVICKINKKNSFLFFAVLPVEINHSKILSQKLSELFPYFYVQGSIVYFHPFIEEINNFSFSRQNENALDEILLHIYRSIPYGSVLPDKKEDYDFLASLIKFLYYQNHIKYQKDVKNQIAKYKKNKVKIPAVSKFYICEYSTAVVDSMQITK